MSNECAFTECQWHTHNCIHCGQRLKITINTYIRMYGVYDIIVRKGGGILSQFLSFFIIVYFFAITTSTKNPNRCCTLIEVSNSVCSCQTTFEVNYSWNSELSDRFYWMAGKNGQ